MSSIIDIQQFLVGKTFNIPPYQRDYAWTTGQVDDLFCDIQEALETGSGHYLGTIVLAKNGGQSYELVDGQQRLTTLTLVIQALLKQLDHTDSDCIANDAILLRNGSKLKVDLGNNASFVDKIFSGNTPTPTSAGQRKLQSAYGFAQERAKALLDEGGSALVKKWLETIKSLEIIQFVATDTGRAIRMFQTVNDRGIPLTAMDKAKALLVYYSNRYLSGSLDGDINYAFGDCFTVFDAIRELVTAPGYRIDNIARDTFTEDDLLRYHYLAYSHKLALNASDYNGTVRTVFDGFLKGSLKKLCQQPADLDTFIRDYISDLRLFALSFRQLVGEIKTDERIFRLFVILGLAARLYPLTIRLHQRGLLRSLVPNTTIDLLHCIEICDARIYKTRGTDPAKDIGHLSHRSRTATVQELGDNLRNFVMWFMPDGTFQTSLAQDMYHNGALTLFLVSYEEHVAGAALGHPALFQMVTDKITREHIIAQAPNWSITSQGFTDETDFNNHLHMFGNLTLLSKSDNSRCQNQPTHTKMTDPKLYARSSFVATRQLVHQYGTKAGMFTKSDVLKRTQALSLFVIGKWAIW